jgi:stage II sporulation protein D
VTVRRAVARRWAARTALAGAAVLAGGLLSAPSAEAAQVYYVPITKAWTIKGHGFGHGHGMSQYGAQGAALQGLKYRDIVDFYFPKTRWDTAKGNIRVLVSGDTSSDLEVRPQQGLAVRDLVGKDKWTLPAKDKVDRWRLLPTESGHTVVQFHTGNGWRRWDIPGRRDVLKGNAQFEAAGPLTLLVPGGNDVVGRTYRGVLRSAQPYRGASARDTVNVVSMDQYVQGVVPYEMPASWKQQALRAQTVAARSFAAWERAQNPSRYWQICDTTSCQVYGGVDAEQASSNAAVKATAGQILTFNGKPAMTQFSSSSGGWTADGGLPYLPAKADPYDDFPDNAMHSWTQRVSARLLQSSHPELGRLIDVKVTKRDGNGQWKGRVIQVVLHGTKGKAFLTGDDFRWTYGLRSNWFTIAPTPIMERWRHLGGDKSGLGAPKSGEYRYDGGSAQDFKHGQIVWSADTGARDLKGPILKSYKRLGGPSSDLGWPATGMMPAPNGGHKVRFQHGKMFSTVKTGAHFVNGPILKRWQQEGAAASWLGFPTTNVQTTAKGLRGTFEGGRISWDKTTHEFTVTHT